MFSSPAFNQRPSLASGILKAAGVSSTSPVSSLVIPKTALQAGVLNFHHAAMAGLQQGVSPASPMESGAVAASGAESSIKLFTPAYFGACAVGGILSCGLTHAATTPLDLVKCRMQVDPTLYKNTVHGFRSIVQAEGGAALLTGIGPTLVGYSLQGLFKFGFYEVFKYYYSTRLTDAVGFERASALKDFVFLAASASAEVFADVALCPFEAVKVKVQTTGFKGTPSYAAGLADGLPKMYAEGGLGLLYKGLTPLWMRQIPYTMMKFAAFERTVAAIYSMLPKDKSEYSKTQQLGVTFAAGYIAGVLCAIVSQPADNAVSIMNKSGGTFMGIIRDLGPVGVWRGLAPRIVMIGTLTGLQWFIYDGFKSSIGLPSASGGIYQRQVETPEVTAE